MNAVGMFLVPKRWFILAKGVFLKQRKRVVAGFVSPKRRFTQVVLPAA
jgi:hypothetical protein